MQRKSSSLLPHNRAPLLHGALARAKITEEI
jgi:hypothetical protein